MASRSNRQTQQESGLTRLGRWAAAAFVNVLCIIQIVYIILKQNALVDWTWAQTLSPTIVYAAVALAILLVIGLAAVIENRDD